MTKLSQAESSVEGSPIKNDSPTMVLRIPKPNVQIVVLGLVAAITLFQTFQLVRISSKANSVSVKAESPVAATTTNSGPSTTGGSAEVPESMVGGC